jgi:hypothetical protein
MVNSVIAFMLVYIYTNNPDYPKLSMQCSLSAVSSTLDFSVLFDYRNIGISVTENAVIYKTFYGDFLSSLRPKKLKGSIDAHPFLFWFKICQYEVLEWI